MQIHFSFPPQVQIFSLISCHKNKDFLILINYVCFFFYFLSCLLKQLIMHQKESAYEAVCGYLFFSLPASFKFFSFLRFMSLQNDKAQLLRLVTDLLITRENTKWIEQVVPDSNSLLLQQDVSPFRKTYRKHSLAGTLHGQEFVVSFPQGVQAQTVTILYSQIKNFLNEFQVIYGLICLNTSNNMGGVWVVWGVLLFVLILYIHTSSLKFKWLWH